MRGGGDSAPLCKHIQSPVLRHLDLGAGGQFWVLVVVPTFFPFLSFSSHFFFFRSPFAILVQDTNLFHVGNEP